MRLAACAREVGIGRWDVEAERSKYVRRSIIAYPAAVAVTKKLLPNLEEPVMDEEQAAVAAVALQFEKCQCGALLVRMMRKPCALHANKK